MVSPRDALTGCQENCRSLRYQHRSDRDASRALRPPPSIGRWRLRIEQFFALELAPEFDRDLRRQPADILFHFAGAQRSRDHRAYGWMEQRELHGGRPEL